MKIKKVSFYNKESEWKLEPILFSDLTLLVGVSGVGKTQILDAILDLKRIAGGQAINGVSWEIIFLVQDGREYFWSGEFEKKDSFFDGNLSLFDDEDQRKEKPIIISEALLCDNTEIISRDKNRILFHGTPTPKLSPSESILSLLSEEDDIKEASKSFKRIIHSDHAESQMAMRHIEITHYDQLIEKYDTLEKIQNSYYSTHLKLALVYKSVPDIFNKIKEQFIDIFPQVENIILEVIKDDNTPFFMKQYPLLQLKEQGVPKLIRQEKISSGMYRTIQHLGEIFLWPKGTVVLIDEFENSLGINCINVLTQDLVNENRKLQFIITSHHPYIINTISPDFWKIVTRQGGTVTVNDADKFDFNKSNHQAFIQLINQDVYRDGIFTK